VIWHMGGSLGRLASYAVSLFECAEPAIDLPTNVVFWTDIEGNWDYLLRLVRQSAVITHVHMCNDGSVELSLADGWTFVFGGDATDKGGLVGGSLRVVRTLVRLKRRYPSRVVLLLGNRDINHMRFRSELAPSEMAAFRTVPGPYFVRDERQRVSPLQYLTRTVAAETGVAPEKVTDAQLVAANTLANRVRWLLKETMGAEGELERRQAELTLLRSTDEAYTDERLSVHATEEETARSFVTDSEAGGWMFEYLHLGVLAAVVNGTLYVHGGIINGTCTEAQNIARFGSVPGRSERAPDTHTWVAWLNEWKEQMVAEWDAAPYWVESSAHAYENGLRGAHALFDYIVMGRDNHAKLDSVVAGRHLDGRCMPAYIPATVVERMHASGVRRLVVGHTPHGNCPTVIKQGGPGIEDGCFETIMADTSYSDMSQLDNRGTAASEVCVLADGHVRIHGVLQDSTRLDYTLAPGVGPPDELVGQLEPLAPLLSHRTSAWEEQPPEEPDKSLPNAMRGSPSTDGGDHQRVWKIKSDLRPAPKAARNPSVDAYFGKALLPERGELLLSHVEGFQVSYERMPLAAAHKLFRGEGVDA